MIANNLEDKEFLKCVSTKDVSVYSIITDKDKMSNLKDLSVEDLDKINNVAQICKVK